MATAYTLTSPKEDQGETERASSVGIGLGDLVRKEHDYYADVNPGDSVSQYGVPSCTSSRARSISSEKARAMQREIELATKAVVLKKRRELENKQAEIDRQVEREEYEARWRKRRMEAQKAELEFQKEQLTLEAELEAAKAISKVYRVDNEESLSDLSSEAITKAIIKRAEEIQQQSDKQANFTTRSEPISSERVYSPSDEKVYSPSDEKVYSPSNEKVYSPSGERVYSPSSERVYSPSNERVYSSSSERFYSSDIVQDSPMVSRQVRPIASRKQQQIQPDLSPSTGKQVMDATPGDSRNQIQQASSPSSSKQDKSSEQVDRTEELLEHQSNLTKLLIDQQVKTTLPQSQIPIFTGSPLEYANFIRAFEFGVESKTKDPQERLYYLIQYTSGQAQGLVKSCLHLPKEQGYLEAKKLLNKQFGNKHKIAEAIMQKASDWTEIKSEDGRALRDFALFLSECEIMMKGLNYLTELHHTSTIRMLSNKLPYLLRRKWRNKTDSIQEELDRMVQFGDLVAFVDREARIVNNPTYGKIADNTSSKKQQPQRHVKSAIKRSSFATSTKEESVEGRCLFCNKDNHAISECFKLTNKSIEERLSYIKGKKLCFGCLKKGHMKSTCPDRDSIKCKKCDKMHPTVLHDPDRNKKHVPAENKQPAPGQQQNKPSAQKQPGKVTSGSVALQPIDESQAVNPLMAIIPVLVRQQLGEKCIATFAFLDNGCGAVFADSELTQELNATARPRKLLLGTLNSEEIIDTEVVVDKLQVGRIDGENFVDLPSVYVKDGIPVSVADKPSQDDVNEWPHLAHIQLPELDLATNMKYRCIPKVTILIGSNVPAATMPLKTATGEVGEPYGVYTPLGWAIYGIPGKLDNQVLAHFCSIHTEIKDGLESLEQQFKAYVGQEFNEKLNDDRLAMSAEDAQFLDMVSNTTHHTSDGHYEMGLPFRDSQIKMPNNKTQVEQRTNMLKRKFAKNPGFYEEYRKAMQQTIEKGYAELVPEAELTRSDGNTWYIPHHGVYNQEKKKMRIVYDCAATYHGRCLNKELLQGPDLTNTLLGVLLRFRQEQIGLMADIESMFCQVRVPIEDRDYLRFLWWPEGNTDLPLQEYRMTVHLFGATSSPACSNYALRRTADDNQQHYSNQTCDTVKQSFYVDDCLQSVSTVKEGVQLTAELMSICSKGGFRLTKWISNSREVLESIPREERAKEVKELDLEHTLPIERALGLQWQVEPDVFGFRVNLKDRPLTRRGMLSTLCSLYDPLGFVSPAILPAKQILQELCRRKIGWDEDVPEEIKKKWCKWIASIPELKKFTMQRCWKPVGFENPEVQLHHFADASDSGYGTATYMRLTNSDGAINSSLVISKSRVAPLKKVSIPRMELSAATTAVRVDTMLKRELDIQGESVYWSDSQTVLKLIKNERARYPVFVANRVAVIRDGSSSEQWRYVPTELNPADYTSRGLTASQLMGKSCWLKGPDFLSQPEEAWPVIAEPVELHEPMPAINVNAVRADEEKDSKIEAMVEGEKTVEKLMEHYSDWSGLKRAVAWWLRLRRMLCARSRKKQSPQENKYLTVDEISEAEKAVLSFVQQQAFSKEIHALTSGKNAKNPSTTNTTSKTTTDERPTFKKEKKGVSKTSSVRNLDPVYADGLLRVGGRLRHATIPEDARHQLILPKDNHVSDLIIKHYHHKCRHQGRNHTLSELRQKFWIIKAGVAIKSLLRRCLTCRKVQAKVSTQKMADLPPKRVKMDEPPFTYTGMDFFGPIEVKQGRSCRKRYGVVFTCFNSRAIHIEIADSLDTSSCIEAIRRFMARRGTVREIYSDNGTNLVGADKELQRSLQELNQDQTSKFCSNNGIQWHFNPPAASHHGGVWERQIRTIRKILSALLHEQNIRSCRSDEQLRTLMCEIESTINSRPLTRVSTEPEDLNVIRPQDLLLPQTSTSLPPGIFNPKDIYAKRRWRQVQYIADIFWKRWRKEYLPELQRRQKWLQPQRNIEVGDVVMIVDEKASRNSWPLGIVQEVYVGNQGLVRSVKVKTKSTTLVRPISKLCLLLEQEN